MLRKLLPLLAVMALLLGACQPQTAGGKVPISGTPMAGCEVSPVLPTPNPTLQALIPAPGKDDHILGKDTALVTIIEYSDYQCPYCAMLAPVLHQLVEKYPDDVRVVFRYFPLTSHPNSWVAAQAAEAAGKQGKFVEMHELIFAQQDQLANYTPENALDYFVTLAEQLKLNVDQFKQDYASEEVKARIQKNLDEAMNTGLPGTPFLFLNGLPYQDRMDLETLSSLVELFKLQARQYTSCPPMIIDTAKQYTATLETEKGKIVIQLYADKAPLAVNSFVFLAREGFFNGVTFHRVLPGFVAQAGDPSGSGYGGPGYVFKNENTDAKFDRKGLVAMANSGADTNGSQFFITYDAQESLNGNYTIFGEVIEGMDVVESLTPRDPASDQTLQPGTKILKVTISEK